MVAPDTAVRQPHLADHACGHTERHVRTTPTGRDGARARIRHVGGVCARERRLPALPGYGQRARDARSLARNSGRLPSNRGAAGYRRFGGTLAGRVGALPRAQIRTPRGAARVCQERRFEDTLDVRATRIIGVTFSDAAPKSSQRPRSALIRCVSGHRGCVLSASLIG
jgi:hypothetical protein